MLTGAAMAIAAAVAVPAAVITARRGAGVLEGIVGLVALLGQSMPTFWLGLVLVLFCSVEWRLLPPSGLEGPQSLILPALTLGAYSAAAIMRVLRSSLVEVLRQDYILTARSKGLAARAVLYGHALRNAAIPAVTVVGLQVGVLLGGAVVTEVVFAYPGMGRLALQSITSGDFPVVQAFVVLTGTLIAVINLLVDLLYAWLDPRIRYA
jgi:peptide/nickel transport system permease protein